ncbi:CHAT domain-containing protein [Actinosynnema sp. NPDC023658]|uniref:CHAT domain-containing protein n=1 Tax=Actinosynnema sp. NPDC023658 TaxID=3155465 RepID=UPI0033E0226E
MALVAASDSHDQDGPSGARIWNDLHGSVNGPVVLAGTITGGVHVDRADGVRSAGFKREHRVDVELLGAAGGFRLRHRFADGSDHVTDVSTSEVTRLVRGVGALLRRAMTRAPQHRSALLAQCGSRLHTFVDTAERVLTGYRDRTKGSRPTMVLAINADEEIAQLPWELLHDGSTFLVAAPDPVVPVRVVTSGGQPHPVAKRGLRLLYMACAPVGDLPELDYDAEHDVIIKLAREHPLEPHFDDTGNLVDLEGRWGEYDYRHFDVIHLDGHVGYTRGEVVLATEGVRGERVDADAIVLRDAIRDSGASVLFLSGRPMGGEVDDFPTGRLAARLAGSGIPVVVGWDRRTPDAHSTEAVKAFYQVLALGRTVAEALAATYRSMVRDGGADWPALRVFVAGELPGALVPAPRSGGGVMQIIPRPDDEARGKGSTGFIGRRRELQDAVRLLGVRATPDPVGLVLCGMGGLGKTRLARRIEQRLAADYQVVRVADGLTEQKLVDAIAADIERDVYLHDVPPTLPLVDRLTWFLRRWSAASGKLLLFELDAFEHSFEADPGDAGAIVLVDGKPTTATEAASVLNALVNAVRTCGYGPHRILMTTRYPPDLPCLRYLEVRRLSSLGRSDLERVVARRAGEDVTLSAASVDEIISTAGGNTRLTEWLVDAVRREVRVEPDALRAVLRHNRLEFLEKDVFAPLLLNRISRDDARVLRAASPFHVPVSVDVLSRLTGADASEAVWRLANLGLLEHRTGDVDLFALPGVLRARYVAEHDPAVLRARHAACAGALAAQAKDPVEAEDLTEVDVATLREVHRLARLGANLDLEVETAIALADHQLFRLRFTEARELCSATLQRLHEHGREHHVLYMILSEVKVQSGEGRADLTLAKALEVCPPDADGDRAEILTYRGFRSADHSPEHAMLDLDEAITLVRGHHRPNVLAFALRTKARALAAARPRGWEDQVRELITEALDLVPRDGLYHAAVLLDRAVAQHLARNDAVAALEDLNAALAIDEAKGTSAHQAITLLTMADAALRSGRIDLAVRWVDDAAARCTTQRIKSGVDLLRGSIAHRTGDLASARAHFEAAHARAELTGHLGHQLDALVGLRRVHAAAGDREAADLARKTQDEVARKLADPTALINTLIESVTDELTTGTADPGAAVEWAREAAAIAAAMGRPDREIPALQALLDLSEVAGLPEASVEGPLRRMLVLLGASGRGGSARIAKRLGVLLLRAERFAEARPVLESSLEHYERHGLREAAAEVRERLSEVARALGRADEAERHLWAAAEHRLQVRAYTAAAQALRAVAAVRPDRARDVLALARRLTRIAASGLDEEQVLLDLVATDDRCREQAALARARAQPLRVEVAPDLVACVDPERGGRFLAGVDELRADVRADSGWVLPEVLVGANSGLPATWFVISVWGKPAIDGPAVEPLVGDRATTMVAALRAVVRAHQALLSGPEPAPEPDPEVDVLTAEEILAVLRERA